MDVCKTGEEAETIMLLDQCNTEIVRLEALLNEQRHLRIRLEKKLIVIRYRGKSSPLERVPAEILQEIFKHVVVDNSRNIGVIAMVCRRWIQLVFNSPALWSRIKMRLVPDVYAVERDTAFLETAIRNSGFLPLDVNISIPGLEELYGGVVSRCLESQSRGLATIPQRDAFRRNFVGYFSRSISLGNITGPFTPHDYIRQAVERIFNTLSGSSGRNFLRLRRLSIEWDDRYFQEVLLNNYFHHPTPLLQALSLRCVAGNGPDVVQPFRFHAPNLTSLSTNLSLNPKHLLASNQLIELDINTTLTDYNILRSHANSIERLSVYYDNDSRIPESLTDIQCPRLVELSWRCRYPSSNFRAPPNTPNLEILRCMDTSIQDIIKILLDTPKLKQLYLWLPKWFTMSDAGQFSDTLETLPLLEEIYILYRPDSQGIENFRKSITGIDSRISVRAVEVTDGDSSGEFD
jgi:hypothetical protein